MSIVKLMIAEEEIFSSDDHVPDDAALVDLCTRIQTRKPFEVQMARAFAALKGPVSLSPTTRQRPMEMSSRSNNHKGLRFTPADIDSGESAADSEPASARWCMSPLQLPAFVSEQCLPDAPAQSRRPPVTNDPRNGPRLRPRIGLRPRRRDLVHALVDCRIKSGMMNRIRYPETVPASEVEYDWD
ncbi:hypothetical protein EVAR_6753_1 [Eumeta japonica]|uniref:Uncharacterized protein n=1 Tax=Eumeta variegata TaxID=151549 RepID=A0A4C1V594_EUMVA|nr:hypothetical protein EVAR_6753_1 [Eumeta japonica]